MYKCDFRKCKRVSSLRFVLFLSVRCFVEQIFFHPQKNAKNGEESVLVQNAERFSTDVYSKLLISLWKMFKTADLPAFSGLGKFREMFRKNSLTAANRCGKGKN